MAAAHHGSPGPDRYQLLGVPHEASRESIAQAWRRRALAEHPDSRPGDTAAPSRFRALAQAWQVLGDPARRAAYDQTLARARNSPPPSGPPASAVVTPAPTPRPPLWAGPVQVDGPHRAPAADRRDEEQISLAVLAGLTLRYLAWDRDWP
jgi:curved DNA-binding protein CbpA